MSDEALEEVIESMRCEIESLRDQVDDLKWERDELEGRVFDYEYGDCDECYARDKKMVEIEKIAKALHKEIHRGKGEAYHYHNCLAFPCVDFHAKGVK